MRIYAFLPVILFFVSMPSVDAEVFRIETSRVSLVYRTSSDSRLYQAYLGEKLTYDADLEHLPDLGEAYIPHGMEDYFEPAIRVLHTDGNPSLLLKYVSHEVSSVNADVTETVITLRDEIYPVEVRLRLVAYYRDDIIVSSAEMIHHEGSSVTLYNYASGLFHFAHSSYSLTEFTGDWANEVNISETPLVFGKKVLDTKLGSRASMFCSPFFILSFDGAASEDAGHALLGTLGWTGNFRFTFEVDQHHQLRLLAGINPYASEYTLLPGDTFRLPEFIFTYSTSGTGNASRSFHRWAREYRLKDGMGDRLTLLNNWESTYFDFSESKLLTLLDEAVGLGVDMFLLDDGWFGERYPRNSDRQGLGDWMETKSKLPHGIGYLVKESSRRGLKFGLWIEPEMVNPLSDLYAQHRDWVIRYPNRTEYYFRNQLVLDLSNPAVQDYVFGVVDSLLTRYPGIAYFKWDCNSPITNIYSPYLGDRQSHLYIEHVRGLYAILDRVNKKYPDLPMMLCSGGGGRSDYEALRYFTEFWPSDNTDAIERIFIQWGFGYFFPAKSLSAHVTSWGKQPLKFRTDVAMMGKLGFDLRVADMSEAERTFCRSAVQNYNRLKPVILDGSMYRLYSPYAGEHAAVLYADTTRRHAVLFAFDMHPRYGDREYPLRLRGLDPALRYEVREINLFPGTKTRLHCDGKTYSGEYLMKVGIPVFSSSQTTSHVIELSVVE